MQQPIPHRSAQRRRKNLPTGVLRKMQRGLRLRNRIKRRQLRPPNRIMRRR
jgi:hypothetical protein